MKINNNKIQNLSHGFTLAEVLITLVIIGIVAALTISAVINTYVERSTVTKLKKCVSTLAQAKRLAETKHGPVETWDVTSGSGTYTVNFMNYLKPFILMAKDCNTSTTCVSNSTFKHLNGTTYGDIHKAAYYRFLFPDGSLLYIGAFGGNWCSRTDGNVPNSCALIWYDADGPKGSATIGKDLFILEFARNGIFPYLSNDCRKNSYGYGCASYIIKNSDMKYLH